ncbi:MAG: hypothetical protein ACI8UO_004709 [Verrucomicrobiales bacterium]
MRDHVGEGERVSIDRASRPIGAPPGSFSEGGRVSEKTKIYGYSLDQLVVTVHALVDERGVLVPVGETLRLVAFAPKVRLPDRRYATEYEKRRRESGLALDWKTYFYNAVRADGEDTHSRIRANFCTIRKLKGGY